MQRGARRRELEGGREEGEGSGSGGGKGRAGERECRQGAVDGCSSAGGGDGECVDAAGSEQLQLQ